jgi:plasmid maintenance system antidote protein VapI
MREVSTKWIEFIDDLISSGKEKNKSTVAKKIRSYSHTIKNIRTGKRNVSLAMIEKTIEVYGLNPKYLFGKSDIKYLHEYEEKRKDQSQKHEEKRGGQEAEERRSKGN